MHFFGYSTPADFLGLWQTAVMLIRPYFTPFAHLVAYRATIHISSNIQPWVLKSINSSFSRYFKRFFESSSLFWIVGLEDGASFFVVRSERMYYVVASTAWCNYTVGLTNSKLITSQKSTRIFYFQLKHLFRELERPPYWYIHTYFLVLHLEEKSLWVFSLVVTHQFYGLIGLLSSSIAKITSNICDFSTLRDFWKPRKEVFISWYKIFRVICLGIKFAIYSLTLIFIKTLKKY